MKGKKLLKKTVVLTVALAIAVGAAACGSKKDDESKSKKTYVVGTEPTFAPFDTTDADGNIIGFDMDLMKAIGKNQGFEVKFIKNYKDTFTGKIIYQFASDEEGPYGLGTVALIKDNVDGLTDPIDFAIIAEPSAAFTESVHPNICLGAKGGYNYTIKLHGKASHAAIPDLGINAVDDAAEVIRRLRDISPVIDEHLGKSLQCVISVKGGGNACSVPDYAEIEVFRHCVRGESINSIYNEVEKAIKQAGIKSKWEIVFRQALSNEFDGGFVPFCTDPGNECLKTLIAATTKVCGREPSFSYFQSIGDFNHIGGLLSIPTVLFGADGDSFHSYDERVKIQSVVEISNSVLEFLKYIHLNNGREK